MNTAKLMLNCDKHGRFFASYGTCPECQLDDTFGVYEYLRHELKNYYIPAVMERMIAARIAECAVAGIDPLDYRYVEDNKVLQSGMKVHFMAWCELSERGIAKRNDPQFKPRA